MVSLSSHAPSFRTNSNPNLSTDCLNIHPILTPIASINIANPSYNTLFGRDAADGDEVAKGELRAATYSELALGTSLTRNEPDRVDCPGKAPRGESAQPGINVNVYYGRRYAIDAANKYVYRIAAPLTRPRPFLEIKKPRWTTPSQEGESGRGGAVRPPRTHRGGPFWPLWCTSWISVD